MNFQMAVITARQTKHVQLMRELNRMLNFAHFGAFPSPLSLLAVFYSYLFVLQQQPGCS